MGSCRSSAPQFASVVFSAIACMAPIWGHTPEGPGVVNFVEGAVSIDGVPVRSASAGSITAGPGQVISTGAGMAEILLTPGTFLRLGNRTAVTLQWLGPSEIQAEVIKGQAMIEALQISHRDSLTVEENGVVAVIQKPGLYDFNSARAILAVYD